MIFQGLTLEWLPLNLHFAIEDNRPDFPIYLDGHSLIKQTCMAQGQLLIT